MREFEPVPATATYGVGGKIPHSILVAGRILRRRHQRGGRILHVDVDDRIDDLVAPRLVLLGEGPESGRLRSLAAVLGIEARVQFAGFIAGASRFLPALDLYASAAYEDALRRVPARSRAMDPRGLAPSVIAA